MIHVFIDGASAGDPGPSGAGIFIDDKNGRLEHLTIPLGRLSNHEAEFHALIYALRFCQEQGWNELWVRTDSKLLEEAIEKRYVRNQRYRLLLEEALLLIDRFKLFFIKWVPSKENKKADELARTAIRLNDINDKK
ncbi:reverse transcriptase-like protein [Halalkalibacterium halodurans]|uniref:BH1770 protein n=1 Tax=Halalkalibacterium halodurans (strain ATCC BAA-125 / DSM 18197 / FERM 7344 / JCM 9153 / C-125) TaxID=272558 RepID=Q9KC04_HALH5|nr:reverse transcriptase-like protein [Halalkalibacterium halodurans]MDY7222330.1 reverse transcriptase-like protein [Halalkalibacterium halodurans]MDY7241551.1 reverse transcriptase-like protein [Halalkalibacterium halodurans]MED3647701.1 reverse transcriptase-like protein [Halalkalibacterium halodurans]MED4082363.1 reverse transcriptase-like protein [Halalkalibacterium halodurans]MED4083486.1 reverse transcriptase-like protein [Halalkalibacterium halodurans]